MDLVVTVGEATELASRLARFLSSVKAEQAVITTAVATAAKPAVSLSTTPLSASAGAGAATATVTIEAADETVLGLTLGWLLVNRPALSRCSIEGEGEGSTVVLLPVGALQGPGSADAAAPPSVTDDPGNPAAAVWAEANPIDCVEVYHLHCHFNDRAGSEQTAKTLLEDAKAAMTARGVTPLHDHLWHEKNGPHDPWSWELWAETPRALGIAVAHLMRWRRPGCAGELGLHLSVHADTDQEFTDHTLRFGWIGPPDPQPLDVGFFTPPGPEYGGPASHTRQTTATTLWSMGDPWARDPGTGAVCREAYGAMDRDPAPKL